MHSFLMEILCFQMISCLFKQQALLKTKFILLTYFVSSKDQNIDEYMRELLKSVFYKRIRRLSSVACDKSYV